MSHFCLSFKFLFLLLFLMRHFEIIIDILKMQQNLLVTNVRFQNRRNLREFYKVFETILHDLHRITFSSQPVIMALL